MLPAIGRTDCLHGRLSSSPQQGLKLLSLARCNPRMRESTCKIILDCARTGQSHGRIERLMDSMQAIPERLRTAKDGQSAVSTIFPLILNRAVNSFDQLLDLDELRAAYIGMTALIVFAERRRKLAALLDELPRAVRRVPTGSAGTLSIVVRVAPDLKGGN